MRPLRVVFPSEGVELALLAGAGPLHRLDGPSLERAVQAFVRPVLLRRARVLDLTRALWKRRPRRRIL